MTNTTYTPLGHYVNVTGIGECIREQMIADGIQLPERFCVPVPGDIAWDECTCGQLAITTFRTFPSRIFPNEALDDGNQGNCGPAYLVAHLTISILRCAPNAGPRNTDKAPTCERLAASALEVYKDAHAVLRGTMCCVRDLRKNYAIAEFLVGAQQYVGPEGMCVGSELTVFLGYTGVCCG